MEFRQTTKSNIIYETKQNQRFKVYEDYKLKLKAYSKKRFDPFCRWDRITIPYKGDTVIQTTIGQLNFFKWVLEHKILDYIEKNFNENEVGFYKNLNDLGNKIEYMLSNPKKIDEYGKNGKSKYFKLFNNKIITKNIIENTF